MCDPDATSDAGGGGAALRPDGRGGPGVWLQPRLPRPVALQLQRSECDCCHAARDAYPRSCHRGDGGPAQRAAETRAFERTQESFPRRNLTSIRPVGPSVPVGVHVRGAGGRAAAHDAALRRAVGG